MHTTNAYAYNSVTQEVKNTTTTKNQTVNKKQQSINNWMTHTGNNNHILHIIK